MSDNKTAKQTIVENGTEFEGVIRSQCPIVISGDVKGEVSAPTLTLTSDGSVHGKVKVKQLKSAGSLGGEIDAESVELSGRVSDNTVIRSAALEVKLQEPGSSKLQVSFENCELQVGDPSGKVKPEMQSGNKKEHSLTEPVGVN
jgi:cytoskeletal protein CcmA (bactofilin family)